MNKNMLPRPIRKIGSKIKDIIRENNFLNNLRSVCALRRISEKGIRISNVIDIGASDGRWSKMCMSVYPNAQYFLVEAQKPHEANLQKFVEKHKNAKYVISAAGNEDGEIWFDDTDLFGGVASKQPAKGAKKSVSMISMDSLAIKENLKGPFLLKLDTHGFELPILEGAKELLKNTNIVIIEAYNFNITSDALLFDEMCAYMRNLGFRVVDISEPMWRPKDRSLWQIDLFFIRADNSLFRDIQYN